MRQTLFKRISDRREERRERRSSSAEVESAINHALTADTVADATKRPVITEEGALNISAVWACVRILSETVGTLPIHLYRRTNNGRESQRSHPCNQLLVMPNSYSTRYDLMHHLMVSVTLWGNGYARIYHDKYYRPTRLKLLHPYDVSPVLDDNDNLYYRINTTGELLDSEDMIHLRGLSTNGYTGKSPIAVHRDNLALTVAAQEYGERFFNQGGQPTYEAGAEGVCSLCPARRRKTSEAQLICREYSSIHRH